MGTGFDIVVVNLAICDPTDETRIFFKTVNGEVVDDVKQVFPAFLDGIS